MPRSSRRTRVRLILLVALLAALPLHAKELHWRSVDVEARLEKDGTLHVRERQAFVFDGDWNGGERRFRVDEGQSVELTALTRIAPSGAIPLRPGELTSVDEYRFQDN